MPKLKKDESIFLVTPKSLLADTRLSCDARILWLYLASMDFKGVKKPFPSRKHLAEVLNCSVRSVDSYLKELESFGAVKRRVRLGLTTLYEVTLPEQYYPCKNNTGGYAKSAQVPMSNSAHVKTIKVKEYKTKEINPKGLEKLREMKQRHSTGNNLFN